LAPKSGGFRFSTELHSGGVAITVPLRIKSGQVRSERFFRNREKHVFNGTSAI
jgi:hypothetical protein